MDFNKKLRGLNFRRYDDIKKSLALSNEVSKISSETEKYLVGAMEEVPAQYTDIIVRSGERVRDQLKSYLNNQENIYPDFDFQGSVTNNTHIRLNSDIDLITANNQFFTRKEGAYQNYLDFQGSPENVIVTLKSKCKAGLELRFPAATVEVKAKSICVSGGSLQRPVDVIPCAWIKGKDFECTGNKIHLGIRLYDTDSNTWIENYPFKHNAELHIKDSCTAGNVKRVIRLLKNLREDADSTIQISSYDICGLVFNCDSSELIFHLGDRPYAFLDRFLKFSKSLETDLVKQLILKVPNGTRLLFSDDGLKVSDLKKINLELSELLQELRRPFKSSATLLAQQSRTPSLSDLLKGSR